MSRTNHDPIILFPALEAGDADALAVQLLARFEALYAQAERHVTLRASDYLPEGPERDRALGRLHARQEEIGDQMRGLQGLSLTTLQAVAQTLDRTYWRVDQTEGHFGLIDCVMETLGRVSVGE